MVNVASKIFEDAVFSGMLNTKYLHTGLRNDVSDIKQHRKTNKGTDNALKGSESIVH